MVLECCYEVGRDIFIETEYDFQWNSTQKFVQVFESSLNLLDQLYATNEWQLKSIW